MAVSTRALLAGRVFSHTLTYSLMLSPN